MLRSPFKEDFSSRSRVLQQCNQWVGCHRDHQEGGLVTVEGGGCHEMGATLNRRVVTIETIWQAVIMEGCGESIGIRNQRVVITETVEA